MAKPKAGEVALVPTRAVSKRTKAPAKKVVSKKNDVQSMAVKPEKTAKRVLKTVAMKKEKTPTRAITVQAEKEVARKIAIVENISRKRSPEEKTITQKPTQSFPSRHLAVVSSTLGTVLLAPFKLQVDQSQFASGLARYVGAAFIVAGALLTFYNTNAVAGFIDLPGRTQSAQTSTATCDPLTTSGCTTSTTNTTTAIVDQKPKADILVEASTNTITGMVPVNVTVPYATRVDLVAQNRLTNQTQSIATLFRVTDLVWRAYWQTTAFADAPYRLRAVITNQYGTYTQENSTDYIVANNPLDTTTSTVTTSTAESGGTSSSTTTTSSPVTTTDTTTTPSTTTTATTSPLTTTTATTTGTIPSLHVEVGMAEPLHGKVTLKTLVQGATSVRHYVRTVNALSSTLLGDAYLNSTGDWRYVFDTTRIPDGEYDLRTQAIFSNGTSNQDTQFALTIKNAGATTTTSVAFSTTTAPAQTTDTAPLTSQIAYEFTQQRPFRDALDVYMKVSGAPALAIELYLVPDKAITPRYLGSATLTSSGVWRYRFDTTLVPNGDYGLMSKVRNAYGETASEPTKISIQNQTTTVTTPETTSYINNLQTTSTESEKILTDGTEPASTSPQPAPLISPVLVTQEEQLKTDLGTAYTDAIAEIIDAYNAELTRIMREFGKAVRDNNEERERALLAELDTTRTEILAKVPKSSDRESVLTKIKDHMESITQDLRKRTEKSEALIKERVGDAVNKDSDSDGISDYDEVNLYKTDPMSADTDKDGFIDGIEVLNGFDPRNSAREANLQYESPKDQGVVREDILAIDHITTITDGANEKSEIKAQIGGRGLPNSFVTLYIFSTPIVVTVKTDSDGNWSYIFDKELDEGTHELYVGMTDNAGRIVAKSDPLSFVKTAEAFSPVDAAAAGSVTVTPEEPALISKNMLLIIGSVLVVALGIILILLGLHVRPKSKEEMLYQIA